MPVGIYKRTEEGRKNMSLAHKGKISGMLGKFHSEETKNKNRLAHLGKKHSEETKKKMSRNSGHPFLGKKHSEEAKRKISESKKGEKHWNWKKDGNVGRCQLHIRIKKKLKKSDVCDNCKKVPPYDLANISGEYKRDLSDWKWLCRRCHLKEDGRMFKNLKQFQNMDNENKITSEMWKRWYSHKSNKERWIEQEENNPYRHIEEANEENYKATEKSNE